MVVCASIESGVGGKDASLHAGEFAFDNGRSEAVVVWKYGERLPVGIVIERGRRAGLVA